MNEGFADPCLTTWPRRLINKKIATERDFLRSAILQFERAMRFELTTFSLARRRSTTELRPQNAINRTNFLCTMIARWTRSDSNRRSPPCKGGAFPLGHGPDCLPTGGQCRREDSNLHALRATDPKSAASANSATSACVDGGLRTGWWYSRFC